MLGQNLSVASVAWLRPSPRPPYSKHVPEEQQCNSEHQGHIGNIENSGSDRADTDIEKVGDVTAMTHTINDVAQAAATD